MSIIHGRRSKTEKAHASKASLTMSRWNFERTMPIPYVKPTKAAQKRKWDDFSEQSAAACKPTKSARVVARPAHNSRDASVLNKLKYSAIAVRRLVLFTLGVRSRRNRMTVSGALPGKGLVFC